MDSILLFPSFAAGFIMSSSLLRELNDKFTQASSRTDFVIDAKYEVCTELRDSAISGVPEGFCSPARQTHP